MPFYLSPSVNILEATFDNVIPAVSTSIGATVGNFKWGPVNDHVLISSKQELIETFGEVTDINAKDWFTVSNYLDYARAVRVARTANDDFKEAEIVVAANNVVNLAGTHVPGSGGTRTNADYTVYNITQGTVLAGTLFTLNPTDLTVTAPAGEIVAGDVVVVQWLANGELVAHNARDVSVGTWDIVKQINNRSHFSQLEPTLSADDRRTLANVFAKYPGVFGNRIKVAWRDGKTRGASAWEDWLYADQFSFQPEQSSARDEFAMVVLVDGEIVEKYLVDAVRGRKDGDQVSNYFADVINNNSSYIWATENLTDDFVASSGDLYSAEALVGTGTAAAATDSGFFNLVDANSNTVIDAGNAANYGSIRAYVDGIEFTVDNFAGATITFQNGGGDEVQVQLTKDVAFAGTEAIVVVARNTTLDGVAVQLKDGQDGDEAAAGDYILTWNDQFLSSETVDVSILMLGGASDLVGRHIVQNIAEIRKDCVACVSPQQTTVVNVPDPVKNLKDWRAGVNQFTTNHMNVSSSYGVMDGNYKYQYDPYNEKFRWLPLNGDIAGLMARTDLTRDPWWSPGGYNRGQILNVVRLAFQPDRADRDDLYPDNINPIISEPGEGTIMLGDKTMLSRPGAFDRINVRRLFIVLEKAIATMAKYLLFEFNDEPTRQRFIQAVVPYLRDVQARRGIQADSDTNGPGFRVIADESVNTPAVIDRNEFKANILIKPNRSINFIELTFTAVGTGVSFDEVAASFTQTN